MKEQRAREILQALVHGTDPSTGEELPGGTVLQQVDVMRALLAGAEALQESMVRATRRAQLPKNIGRSWSADEQSRLTSAFHAGESLAAIAAKHQRTVRAIESRLERLGLITPEQRVTQNRFGTPVAGPGNIDRDR